MPAVDGSSSIERNKYRKDVMVPVKGIHGGDIYRNQVDIDFSVNVNPLGVPETVKKALHEAVVECTEYPDITAEKLKKAVSNMLSIQKEYLLFGNGASELFMAIVHAIRPKQTVIPVPSFYGYEYAAEAVTQDIVYYPLKRENDFCFREDIFDLLTEEVELFFLANPNNPTGKRIHTEFLKRLLVHCRKKEIYVVLDECFIEFCGQEYSMLSEADTFPNLILVRAFTKIFSIPGVRLGYLICSNPMLLKQVRRQLPEWNLSTFAQKAGCACAVQSVFMKETKDYVRRERESFAHKLRQLGIYVFTGDANFIFIYSDKLLYERLLEQGILIRDCENFKGLSKGYYRIAVKSRLDNERLIKAIGDIC